MKKITNFLMLVCLLLTIGCDSDSSDGDGSSGSGNNYSQPDPIEVVQMTINTRTFNIDDFITQLAAQLEIDENRIVIVNQTEVDNSVVLDLFFEESEEANATSVADLISTAEELTEVGGYSVTVVLVELDECDSAELALDQANAMLTALSNQLHECDHGNDDACLGDDPNTFPFVDIYEQYEIARAYGSGCGAANEAEFGMALLSMFTVTQDQILIEVLDSWQEWEDYEGYFVMDRNSNMRIRSGLPIGISDLASLSNIKYSNYIPIKFVFDKLNQTMSNDRDNHGDIPNFSDVQTIARDVLIPKITNTINHFDNILGEDLVFTITPDMQNDMDTDPVELDDAEIYVMKAFMHQLRSILYAISTYNLDFICAEDIDECVLDLTYFDQDGDFLTINNGAETFFKNAHDDLNNMLESLQGAYDFLSNAGYHENGVLAWADVQEFNQDNDETMEQMLTDALDLINNTQVVEMCTGEEWIYNNEGWMEFQEGTCYDKQVSLSNFMDNPVENWKAIFPPYEVEMGYDDEYDIEQDHAETENYNFDDGCFDNENMMQSTLVMTQDHYVYSSNRNYYFYPENEGIDETVHVEEVLVTIDVSYVEFTGNDHINVGIGQYDWNNEIIGSIYGTDGNNVTFDITNYFNDNNYDGSSLDYTKITLYPNFGVYTDVPVTLSIAYQDYPRLEYYWYSEECWNNYYSDDGDYLGYGCGYQSENTPYPDNYANNELVCADYHGLGTISCDCSDASTFANQVYANMLADDIDFTFIRMIYFPNGSWYRTEPHWDYDVFYYEQDMEPCLTWDADSFNSWQDGWSNWQLNGLFPDMNKNEFFDLLEISEDGWDKFSGECEE